eukprot:3236824-Rhodomonas_salina.1
MVFCPGKSSITVPWHPNNHRRCVGMVRMEEHWLRQHTFKAPKFIADLFSQDGHLCWIETKRGIETEDQQAAQHKKGRPMHLP